MRQIWRILTVARELRGYYIWISILSVVTSLSLVAVPLITGWAIDELRRGGETRVDYMVWLAVALFGLDFASNVLNNYNGFIGDQMAVRLQRSLSTKYYSHLLTLPQSYFDAELSGKLINRLNRSITQITTFMQMFSNSFLQFLVTTLFALIAVAFYSWPVALMLFALYPIYVWMTIRSSGTWLDYQKTINTNMDVASGRFAETVNQLKVVKSFGREQNELRFFGMHWRTIVKTTRPQSRFWHIEDFKRRLILNIIFLGVYLYIFVSAAQGDLTPGQAVAVVLFAQQIRIPIFTISYLVENTQRAVADSRDYFEVMNVKPEITDQSDAAALQVKAGKIIFESVKFAYDGGQAVLKGVSFTVLPDSKVALVGESGEGKTTITNLLLRLYEASDGEITIDGQNIRAVTQTSLRNSIAVVFQEPALFSGTIRGNIAYGRPVATDKEIYRAAKAANAHEFITKFDKAYDTEIGERGLKLSGGQKQRIAIARALLKDAPILILDEATSSLDSKSEVMVQEALERLMKGRTTIIIAHRLSTIQSVDQIVTIHGGQVDESGSPNALAASGGIYAQLLELQLSGGESNKQRLQMFDINS